MIQVDIFIYVIHLWLSYLSQEIEMDARIQKEKHNIGIPSNKPTHSKPSRRADLTPWSSEECNSFLAIYAVQNFRFIQDNAPGAQVT